MTDPEHPGGATEPTVHDLFSAALQRHLGRLLDHRDDLASEASPRAIHQTRVALRRIRSDLATFAPLAKGKWPARLRRRSRDVARAVGEVRDRDVMRERLAALAQEGPELVAPLMAQLDAELAPLRAAVIALARRDDYTTLSDELAEAARHPHLRKRLGDKPARDVVLALAVEPWRLLHDVLDTLDQNTATDEELHAARILAKRSRYALMAVAPAFPQSGVLSKRVAELQDLLGEHQDACVSRAWLLAHGGDDAAPLAERESERAHHARQRLDGIRQSVLDPSARLWMLP